MATVQQTLSNPSYRNWVKGGLVLKFSRDGLQCFVDDATQGFQQNCLNDIWAKNGLAVGTVCNVCTTHNVLPCPTRGTCTIRYGVCNYHDNSDPLKTHKLCPSGICKDLQDIIYKSHRFRGPSWHNTNAQLWCSNSWEIAKCYMAPSGYSTVTSAVQTDLPGLVSVVINLKDFQKIVVDNLSGQNNLFCQARTIRNDILHTATFELADVVLKGYIDTMILLLDDRGNLATDGNAQIAITKLNQLKTDSIAVTNEDEREIREQALRAIDEKKEEAIKQIEETMDEKKEEVKKHIKEAMEEKKEEVTKHIKETMEEKKEEVTKHIKETMEEKKEEVTKHIKETMEETMIDIKEDIQETVEEKKEEVTKHIQNTVEEKKEEAIKLIQENKNEIIREIKTKAEIIQGKETQAYEHNKKDLQSKLIDLYIKHYIRESMFPQKPNEKDMDINEIYAKPDLVLVDLKSKQKGNTTVNKTVHSYKDILFKDSRPYKNMYLTAKAGMGKTTFCKKLMHTWCKAHSKTPSTQTSEDSDDNTSLENEQVMRKFPFLFYVSLRHASSTSEIKDMIRDQLLISEELLSDILKEQSEQCLIILDGLDEWSPPTIHIQKLPYVTEGLPARSTTIRCSILTTTRPWKLEVLKLEPSEIDQHVECFGIDKKAAGNYIRNVIENLNNRWGKSKSPEDFLKELTSRNLNDLKIVPVILQQLICLWHEGKTLENSKCAIYSRMVDLMFELAKPRLKGNPELSNINEKGQNVQISLPKCFNSLKFCQEFKSLVYSLGNLSFKTLMNKNEESTLVFDSSEVKIHGLSPSEIDICLKVGILSQEKVISPECTNQKSFSFIHKTFQEYLAAVFVSVRRDSSDEIIKTICSKINTKHDMFQQSAFLVFVSGMFPEILYQLTAHFDRVVFDEYTFIWPMCLRYKSLFQINAISDLMTECVLESKDNGYENMSIKLAAIFIGKGFKDVLNPVIDANSGNIKSAHIVTVTSVSPGTILGITKDIKCLQKLVLVSNDMNVRTVFAFYADILRNSKDTLIYLSLVKVNYSNKIIPILVDNLRHLTALCIDSCTFTYDGLTQLFQYVTRTTQLQKIYLYSIYCSDITLDFLGKHARLDFSNHQQLKRLALQCIPLVSTVSVNTSKLQRCDINMKYVECLKCGAPNLELLGCDGEKWGNFHAYAHSFPDSDLDSDSDSDPDSDTHVHSLVITLPTLIQLKTVFIVGINFGDRELLLSPEMKNLERVEILNCTMTSRAVCRFVDSVPHTQHSVDVTFPLLTINPSDECKQCLQYIRSCPRFKTSYSSPVANGIRFRVHTVPIDRE